MTNGFVDTATNMVRTVENAIEGYDMGPLRALAQEPVQNSKDAKQQSVVHVEYRLHERYSEAGTRYYLLTVTDRGTTGLSGPVLSRGEREARGDELKDGENWAAFEGQGFTKKQREDALGSRGQGKSAFLYHSRLGDIGPNARERYLILYDTLLANGEYRLGIRYAMPADRVKEPPLYDDDARAALAGEYDIGDGTSVSLNLSPLSETGTRVIVPFLSQDAVEAVHNGELGRWLQRLWWRAIQAKDLQITLVDEAGNTEDIVVPRWWDAEPWRRTQEGLMCWNNLTLDDGQVIKRLVLLYDPDLAQDEIDVDKPQYSGVQLLRAGQWIETLDIRDWVPLDSRQGFRGFVEFDRLLERELKKAERTQHESFNGQHGAVRRVRQAIGKCVKEFAEQQGWVTATQTRNLSDRDQESATEFLRAFASVSGRTDQRGPSGHNDPGTESVAKWNCTLALDYPTPKTARVDWGELIENVSITTEVDPPSGNRWATVVLDISKDGEGSPTVIATREIETLGGFHAEQFGNFQIIRGHGTEDVIQCPEPGEYHLRAVVSYGGQRVASATRRLYIQCDPPPPPIQKPSTLSVSVQNLSREGAGRIHDGDEIGVQVTVTNRSPGDVTLHLDASFEDLLLDCSGEVSLAGTPVGDVGANKVGETQRLRLYTSASTDPETPYYVLEPGRYHVRADLRLPNGDEVLAYSSKAVYFEVDPGGPRPDLPFELKAIEDHGPHPSWELIPEPDDRWVLQYPVYYPVYQELPEQRKRGLKLSGRTAFIADVCANGLLEWALDPIANGDVSRIELLKNSHPDQESYCQHLDQLAASFDTEWTENPREYDRRRRQTVAEMLHIFQGLD